MLFLILDHEPQIYYFLSVLLLWGCEAPALLPRLLSGSAGQAGLAEVVAVMVGVLLLLLPLFLVVSLPLLLCKLRLLLLFQVSMCALLLELRANSMCTSLHQPQRHPPVLTLPGYMTLIRCLTLTRYAMPNQHCCSGIWRPAFIICVFLKG